MHVFLNTHTVFLGDSLHFHNYCTDPVSESAHQEEDDFNPQTSPASETQDDQRNTEPNSGRNGEDAQCGGESIGGMGRITLDIVESISHNVCCNFMKRST